MVGTNALQDWARRLVYFPIHFSGIGIRILSGYVAFHKEHLSPGFGYYILRTLVLQSAMNTWLARESKLERNPLERSTHCPDGSGNLHA